MIGNVSDSTSSGVIDDDIGHSKHFPRLERLPPRIQSDQLYTNEDILLSMQMT